VNSVADFSKRQQQARQAPAIRVLDGKAIAVPIPVVPCLVAEIGLVAGGGATHLVAGYGYSGKTLALQSLALSLAAGRPVWGAYTGTQGRVLHVDLEQGDRLTRRRYQRLAAAMGVDLPSLGDSLGLAIMPPLKLARDHFVEWRDLMAGRDLVIVDSLRAASGGQDENSSEIRGCVDMLGELSEATQCRATLIHHSRKPQRDDPGGRFAIRGSSAIYDACDCVYLFAAAKGEPVSVEQAKARTQGDSIPDFALVISDVEIDGEARAGLRVQVHGAELIDERREAQATAARRDETRRDVETLRRVLAATPGLGSRELRAAVRPMAHARLEAALYALREQIDIREEQIGRAITRRHYLRGGSHA
jgi:RecA-family ATPase